MRLGDFSNIFLNMKNDSFVFKEAFGNTHSYRGYYDEVAFERVSNVTLKQVKESVDAAFNNEFSGYKGGVYRYDSDTTAHLTYYGTCSDDDENNLEQLIYKMVFEYYKSN